VCALRWVNWMKLEVECYSGFKADERPVRFRLNERQYLVEEIVDQWYGTQDVFYKVRADDGSLYVLRRETATPEGAWHLVSFRQMPLNGEAATPGLELNWTKQSLSSQVEYRATPRVHSPLESSDVCCGDLCGPVPRGISGWP
jgi:hypothetical protein